MDIFSDGRNFQVPQILEHNNGTAGPHGHKYVDNFWRISLGPLYDVWDNETL